MRQDEGIFLVKLAREAIKKYLETGEIIRPPERISAELKKKSGVFVTLSTYPDGELRGCIGIPEPIKPLVNATIEAAISSATADPRFDPLRSDELPHVTVEVSILTPPTLIEVKDPREYLDAIEIGRDGLIIECRWQKGLLLPQVPVEQGWDKKEYLACICMKAGLPTNAWQGRDARLYKFEGIVFSELNPEGPVRKKL